MDDSSSTSFNLLKKQRFKSILTKIGESLQEFFIEDIQKQTGELPSVITILDVESEEQKTSRSKAHFVTYKLNTDKGEQKTNLVVKFAKDEDSFIKEISNHEILASSVKKVYLSIPFLASSEEI